MGILWGTLTSPHNRLFLGYFVSSFFLAVWVYVRTPQDKSLLSYVFPRDIWLSKSSQLDFKLIVFNAFVKVFLVGQFVVFSLAIAHGTQGVLNDLLGPVSVGFPRSYALIGYTLALLVINDFAAYWVHRGLHQIPALWSIHQVHHSAETLTPFTLLRVHPLELFVNHGRHIIVAGLVSGIFWKHPLSESCFWNIPSGTIRSGSAVRVFFPAHSA